MSEIASLNVEFANAPLAHKLLRPVPNDGAENSDYFGLEKRFGDRCWVFF